MYVFVVCFLAHFSSFSLSSAALASAAAVFCESARVVVVVVDAFNYVFSIKIYLIRKLSNTFSGDVAWVAVGDDVDNGVEVGDDVDNGDVVVGGDDDDDGALDAGTGGGADFGTLGAYVLRVVMPSTIQFAHLPLTVVQMLVFLALLHPNHLNPLPRRLLSPFCHFLRLLLHRLI